MKQSTFTLPSSRRVGVTEYGNRDAKHTIVFAHPAPGSSFFDPAPKATAPRDLRVIALDRPGYGPSELLNGGAATVARAAEDIADYLVAQNIEKVGIAGWSAGGRIALAFAAAHPELVDRVAVIATPAPDDEVPWVGDVNRAMLQPLKRLSAEEATAALTATFDGVFTDHPNPEDSIATLATPEVDAESLKAARKRLLAMLERAFEQGNAGMAADIVSYTLLDLGFDLADVKAKTLLIYGTQDALIGQAHASWYQDHLSDARIEMNPQAGHLAIVPAWERVLSHLAPGSKAR
ncbi:MAG: hypothetical protein QOI02_644 [Actinomycetota bacterium]|jgi:pimeloyl-ACP methyl ester carboxylesterase|nr:hypothetical protein [Actinomycetota bacterium]